MYLLLDAKFPANAAPVTGAGTGFCETSGIFELGVVVKAFRALTRALTKLLYEY